LEEFRNFFWRESIPSSFIDFENRYQECYWLYW